MSLRINSEVASLRRTNSLKKSKGTVSDALRRISSGLRVEQAADDSGRLQSITRADADVRGYRQSIKNLNDGLSLAQTLEGSLGQIENALQRLRELSVQAASDLHNSTDRFALQEEAQQLIQHIDKIVDSTSFNQISLLDGTNEKVGIFVDNGVTESTFGVDLVNVNSVQAGRKAEYTSQRRGVYLGDLQDDDLEINNTKIRGTAESDDSISFSFSSGSAIAKANAINAVSEVTGVTARAEANEIVANRTVGQFTLDETNYFSINGSNISGFEIEDFDASGTLLRNINSVAQETGVVGSIDSQGNLTLTAADGRNIQIHYSNQFVLTSIGLADTSGDETNLKGEVQQSSLIGPIDRVGLTQTQTSSFTNYNDADVTVGGEFDAAEDFVDFVAHVVEGGNFGTAKIRIDRDPASELVPAEDFAFIEGSVNAAPNTAQVTVGDFLTTGGTLSAGGAYNEGLDREYILTVTQSGTTDGTTKAHVSVETVEDGVIIADLELDANTDLNIGTATTGEDVTIRFGNSQRSQSESESIQAGQTYTKTLNNGVTIGGAFDADRTVLTEVEVVQDGYTQGAQRAQIQVFKDGVASGAAFDIDAGQALDIGDGLTITFDGESPTVTFQGETDPGAADSYAGNVTLVSAADDFVGTPGAGTYRLEITEAGATGQAQYVVKQDGAIVIAASTLQAGDVSLGDGLTLNFEASVSSIGAAQLNIANNDPNDHYQDYAGVTFGGNYDGLLNDVNLQLRVKDEGRVLGAAEAAVATEHAVLEFSIDGGAFQGDIVARAGGPIAITNGVTIEFAEDSDATVLSETDETDIGASKTFAADQFFGFDGTVDVVLDESTFEFGEDIEIRVTTNNGGAGVLVNGADTITVDLVAVNGGATLASATFAPQDGVLNTITNGLEIRFNNAATSIIETPGGGNDEGATITANGAYNGSTGNRSITVQHEARSEVTTSVIANPTIVGMTVTDTYDGTLKDETLTVTFDGATQSIAQTSFGGDGDDDDADISLIGAYSGLDQDKTLTVTYEGTSSILVTDDDDPPDNSFTVTAVGAYNRSSADVSLSVEFDGTTTADVVSAATLTPTVAIAGTHVWADGDIDFSVVFTADDTVDVLHNGATIQAALDANAGINFSDAAYDGIFTGARNLTLTLGNLAAVDESVQPESFTFSLRALQTVSIFNNNGDLMKGGIDVTGGTTVDLSDAEFVGGGLVFAADPGVSLDISESTNGNIERYKVDFLAPQTVSISDGVGNTVNGVDFSGGTVDLSAATFTGVGKMFENDPNLSLSFDNFADPTKGFDDVWTIDLDTATTVTVTNSGGASIVGLDVSDDQITGAELVGLFGGDDPGITIDFTNSNFGVSDSFLITLDKKNTVKVTDNDTGDFVENVAVVGNNIDLSSGTFTGVGGIFEGADPGFDLVVANPDDAINDSFTFDLIRDYEVGFANNSDVLHINSHSLQAGDTISSDLVAGTLEVGTHYEVDTVATHLKAGTKYTVDNKAGTLDVGDVIRVNASHAFQNDLITVEAQTTLSDGLTLDFAQDGPFTIGDEIRFQARGYTGDFVASGEYTDPAFPTTFEVEVTTTGDVDGGAIIKYTRLDNGETAGGIAAASVATFLQDGVNIAFTAGKRLYAGDRFFIDTISALSQNFGSQLTLESSENIEIKYNNVDVDNQLGRLLYVGDPDLADDPGTVGSLDAAFLGVNSDHSLATLTLLSSTGADDALRIVDETISQISAFRSEVGATQNSMIQQVRSFSEALIQTEGYVSRIRDADIAVEVASLTSAQIQQNAGAEMLRQVNLSPGILLTLLDGLL